VGRVGNGLIAREALRAFKIVSAKLIAELLVSPSLLFSQDAAPAP